VKHAPVNVAVTHAVVTHVPIADIVIGERRRTKLGRLNALVASIKANGLVHPILLRGTTLVAGHRRLEACRSLNMKTIPARQVAHMTDEELRAIELDENTAREGLTTLEASRTRLAQIRQAEADLKSKAVSVPSGNEKRPHRKTGRAPTGRPPETNSMRGVAEATGISPAEQDRVERHVALAEQYPFLQRSGWGRPDALDAGQYLNQLPEADRGPIAALLNQPGIPPEKALPCLAHAVEMESAARRHVIALSTDPDDLKRREALTILAKVPPPADPALGAVSEMVDLGRRATGLCRMPQFRSRIADTTKQISDIYREFSAADKEARRNGQTVC